MKIKMSTEFVPESTSIYGRTPKLWKEKCYSIRITRLEKILTQGTL